MSPIRISIYGSSTFCSPTLFDGDDDKEGNTIDVTAKKCAKNECHSKAALSGVATKADWFFDTETTIKLQNTREGIFWESQPSALQGFNDIESRREPGYGGSKLSKNNGLVTRHVQHCVCANKSDNLLFIQVVEGVY